MSLAKYFKHSKGPGPYGIAPRRRQLLDKFDRSVRLTVEEIQEMHNPWDPRFPFYHLVPKDLDENLEFRRAVVRWGSLNESNAETLWVMCRRDMLFWINTFCWTDDPRKTQDDQQPCLPFITWDYQDETLASIDAAIGDHDLAIEKSRDMGASWMVLVAFTWRWQFHELQSFLLSSRVEDLVDKSEDMDSLMVKIDFMLDRQPGWLLPAYNRTHLHLYNQTNGSVIDGRSTTKDLARGGRRTAMLLDEFAAVDKGEAILSSTADVTRCRIVASTPKGNRNAFYTVTHSETPKISLHWTLHPEKRLGMYYVDHNGDKHNCEHLRREDIGPRGGRWAFYKTWKIRSPWYDAECKRRHLAQEIAAEVDIDYLSSDYQFFDPQKIQALMEQHSRPPVMEGQLHYDEQGQPMRFEPMDGAGFRLWCRLEGDGSPSPDTRYVVGCDIGTGSGASNSCLKVMDAKTGRFVAEYATPDMEPHDFATVAVAAARWFASREQIQYEGTEAIIHKNGALLIWESNGPGLIFGRKVLKLGYSNIYYRGKNVKQDYPKPGDVPGFHSSRDSKVELLGSYRDLLCNGDIVDPSFDTLRECNLYVYKIDGSLVHASAMQDVDITGARDNHADRVIAGAVCTLGMKQKKLPQDKPLQTVPRNCMMYRRLQNQQRQRDQAKEEFAW